MTALDLAVAEELSRAFEPCLTCLTLSAAAMTIQFAEVARRSGFVGRHEEKAVLLNPLGEERDRKLINTSFAQHEITYLQLF